MYGLIHRLTRRPRSLQPARASRPGPGTRSGSQTKSHQWNWRIQKQSKWKTLSGRSRAAIPSTNALVVSSS